MAAGPAGAGPLTVTAPKSISIATPFAPGRGGATEGSFPGVNFNYPNSETEPWLADSPTNPMTWLGSGSRTVGRTAAHTASWRR